MVFQKSFSGSSLMHTFFQFWKVTITLMTSFDTGSTLDLYVFSHPLLPLFIFMKNVHIHFFLNSFQAYRPPSPFKGKKKCKKSYFSWFCWSWQVMSGDCTLVGSWRNMAGIEYWKSQILLIIYLLFSWSVQKKRNVRKGIGMVLWMDRAKAEEARHLSPH